MNNKTIKEHAHDIVVGNKAAYGLALIPLFVYGFLSGLAGNDILFNVVLLVVALVYPYVVTVAFLHITRGGTYSFKENVVEETKVNGLRYMSLSVLTGFLVATWSLLLIIPGYIKSVSYAMAPFITKDNPDISGSESITRSRQLMHGHKMQYFKLYMSFYLWIALFMTIGLVGLFIPLFMIVGIIGGFAIPSVFSVIGLMMAIGGLLTSLVQSIRVLPRWQVAQVLFYEELSK